MSARALWKGVIVAGEERVGVKLYSALEDRNIHFHLLHDQDHVRIQQRMVHPETGETVSYQESRRGVEVDANTLVILDDEDLESLEPEDSRDIGVERFVPSGTLSNQWYERPYYLGPDGDEAAYFALAAALAAAEREGIARWVMRKKEYLGALVEREGYLLLVTLRHAGEVVDTRELDPPDGRQLDTKERKLAGALIDALRDDFEPGDYRETYRQRVRELIEAKAKGEEIEFEPYEEKAETDSLTGSLEASIKTLAARS